MNLMKDYMSENSMEIQNKICKTAGQRCNINMTRIPLLLEVFEHNNNFEWICHSIEENDKWSLICWGY